MLFPIAFSFSAVLVLDPKRTFKLGSITLVSPRSPWKVKKQKVRDKNEKLKISGKPDSGMPGGLNFLVDGFEKVDFLPCWVFFPLLELMSGERLKLAEKFQRESVQLVSGTKVTGADILRNSKTLSKEILIFSEIPLLSPKKVKVSTL